MNIYQGEEKIEAGDTPDVYKNVENKFSDTLLIGGTLLRCNTANSSGIIYPEDVVRKACMEYMIGEKILYGTNFCFCYDTGQVSFVVENMDICEGNLVGEICVLNTPGGTILRRQIGNMQKCPAMYSIRFHLLGYTREVDGIIEDCKLDSISVEIKSNESILEDSCY